jgi:hypothetical protein
MSVRQHKKEPVSEPAQPAAQAAVKGLKFEAQYDFAGASKEVVEILSLPHPPGSS